MPYLRPMNNPTKGERARPYVPIKNLSLLAPKLLLARVLYE